MHKPRQSIWFVHIPVFGDRSAVAPFQINAVFLIEQLAQADTIDTMIIDAQKFIGQTDKLFEILFFHFAPAVRPCVP